MKQYSVDWSSNKVLPLYDGATFTEHKSLRAIIEYVEVPCELAIESTFESYITDEHNALIARAAERDVQFRIVQPRNTSNYRQRHIGEILAGRKITKKDSKNQDDKMDTAIIFELAFKTNYHTMAPRIWPVDDNPSLAKRVVAMRKMDYDNADGQRAMALLKKHGIPCTPLFLSAVLAAEEVVKTGGNRDDFDRIIGAYAHGYPSLFRSNFYHWAVPPLVWAEVKDRDEVQSWTQTRGKFVVEAKVIMTGLRKTTRHIFHLVKTS